MHKDLQVIAPHMKELGVNSLAHAIHLLITPYPDSDFGSYNNDLAVLQAAHAAEILGKAAVAEQHPLLIFSQIPKSAQVESSWLDFRSLFESGKTIGYQEIPERLWAATGYKIGELAVYQQFGKLRNSIQHFASITDNNQLIFQTLHFIFAVIDPLMNHFWGLYAANCIEEGLYRDEHKALYRTLAFWEIDFLVPEEFKHYHENAKTWLEQQPHRGRSLLKSTSID